MAFLFFRGMQDFFTPSPTSSAAEKDGNIQPLKKTVILTHRESNYTPKATTHQRQLHTTGTYTPKATSHHRQLHT